MTGSRLPLAFGALVAVFFIAACRTQPATPEGSSAAKISENAWATVDGREITQDAVEKAYRRLREVSQPLSDEEAMTAKLSLLNDLILQDILMAKAKDLKVEVPEKELDAAYADAKKNITDEAYQQELSKRGLTASDMREYLRRELLTQKVIEQEVGSKISVSAQEVSDFFIANREQFNVPEEAYHLAQIAITPVRDPQVVNRTGDDATTPQAAAAKAAMLMGRLKAGASFADLAMDYSEDPESTPRGGDLGFVPISRLKQAPPQLRDAVLNKAPGSVNWAVGGGGAHTLVLVVAHEMPGQRDLSTPGVRDRINDALRSRKEQLLRAAYLTNVRSESKVVNSLAQRLVASQGKMPSLMPPAPAKK